MTPNLASARQAIQAELAHARQGMEFYSARVEALETALNQLETVEGDDSASMDKGRKSAGTRGRKSAASGRGRKARNTDGSEAPSARGTAKVPARGGKRATREARATRGGGDESKLPTTGTDFWLKLVTDEPRTAVEIANVAAQEIGLKPEQKEQIQKLKQRVAPALATLVAAKKVRDTGAGRERRFFRAEDAES